jgi:PAS domain S-box-containing protein
MRDPNPRPTGASTPDVALDAPARLAALAATGLLEDGAASEVLDRLARVVTRVLGVPVALVSLVGAERQWWPGLAGLTGPAAARRAAPLAHSFCQHVVAGRAPFVVPDATQHPFVEAAPAFDALGVRAYVGVPLVTAAGATLGALCAIARAPRAWTPDDVDTLRDLAAAAVSELELRAALAGARESEARYRTLLRHYPHGAVFLVDHDLRFLVADGMALRAHGFDPAAMIGRALREVVSPESADRLEPHYRAALAGRTDAFAVTHDGRVFDGEAVPVRDADGRVVAGMVLTRDVTAHRQQAAALEAAVAAARESEARLRMALEVAGARVWERDLATDRVHHGALAWTRAGAPDPAAARTGYADFLAAVHPEDRARVAQANADAVARVGDLAVEYRIGGPGGGMRWNSTVGRVLADGTGAAARMVGVTLDVTERVTLEAQLRQSQKMEAVGQLAGGIAHDFNNLLTVISGNLEFLREDLGALGVAGRPVVQDVEEIAQATERARTLVRQLLLFSRQQPVRPQIVAVDEVVRHAEKLLRRVIGEEIVLSTALDAGPRRVQADPSQLEQLLMNLAVNARDAMLTPRHGHPGTGGTLEIATDPVTLSAAAARAWSGVAPGRWVRLQVRDTGHGMDAETQAHAFEPFYTTKEVGVGRGSVCRRCSGSSGRRAAHSTSRVRRGGAPPSRSCCPRSPPPTSTRRRQRRPCRPPAPRRAAGAPCSWSRTRRPCGWRRVGCWSGGGTRCSRPGTASMP